MPKTLTTKQRARLIAEREKTDPVRHYQPSPTFAAYLQSTALYRAISTANQVGKTTCIQVDCVMMARGIHPHKKWFGPVRILVLVPRRAQAAVVWGNRLLKASELRGEIGKHPFIPKREIKHVTIAHGGSAGPYPGRIELKNGSTIYFALSGDVNSWKGLEGMTFDYVFRDEADGSENLADEIQPRLLKAQDNPDRPWAGGIAWAATSTKPNDEWQAFRTAGKDGVVTPVGRYELFSPDPNENPAISAKAREAMADTMSAEAYAIRGTGAATAEETLLIFRKWSRTQHVRSAPYVVKPTDNLWISYDPGWKHPCGILFVAVSRDEPNKLHVVRYEAYKYGTMSEHVHSMAAWLRGRFIEGFVADPAIHRPLPNGVQHRTVLEEELRNQGIRMQNPLEVGRNRLEDMIPQIEGYLERGQLDVDPFGYGCERYIQEMEAYRWDEKAIGRIIYRKAKGGDEGPDVTKYLISKAPKWIDRGLNLPLGEVEPLPEAPASPLDEFAGMDEDHRVHIMRLRESLRIMDEEGIGGANDHVPIGLHAF